MLRFHPSVSYQLVHHTTYCLGSSITIWDNLVEKFIQKFYQLSDHNDDIEEDDDPDDITDIFMIKGNLFDFETPIADVDGFYNGGELPGMIRVESMTYFQDNKWYDELVDGKLKDETLEFKAKVEES
nr:hypothetical protein [Tanacetum cinerariifolium]